MTTLANTTNTTTRRIGIGLPPVSYYDNSFMFTDLAKHGLTVTRTFDSYTNTDSNRFPLSDCLMTITSVKLANGTYKLSFNGKCDNLAANGGGLSVSNKIYDVDTNTTTADVVITDGSYVSNRWVSFSGTHANNTASINTGVTNIKLMRPGYTTEVFTNEFLQAMSSVSIIRAMDYTITNQNDSITWSDRPTPNSLRHLTRGHSWEHLIILANTVGIDLWINVPVKADDTYILNLANLVKYGSDGVNPYTSTQANPIFPPLNSGLRIYVEYGNEIWNFAGGFYCFGWVLGLANAVKSDTTHPIAYDGAITDQYTAQRRYIAYRSAFISLTFRSVFGDDAMGTVVRPILGTQAANANSILETNLNWAEGFYGSIRNTAPLNPVIRSIPDLWYGTGGAAYIDSVSNDPGDTSTATINAYFDGIPNSNFVNFIRGDVMWAKAWGLKVVAYEGGPEPRGSYLGASLPGGTLITATINSDSRMTGLIEYIQQVFDSYGGDEYMYYIYSGTGNSWSFTNNLNIPVVSDTATPKLLGLTNLKGSFKAAPTFGIANYGTFNLKSCTDKVLGSGIANGYQSGTCYSVSSASSYLYIAVLSPIDKTRRIAFNLMNTTNDVLTIRLNGKVIGTITPILETNSTVRTTSYVVGDFVKGVNVLSVRKSATGTSYIRDIVLTSNDVKTLNINFSNPVNADLSTAQISVNINRI